MKKDKAGIAIDFLGLFYPERTTPNQVYDYLEMTANLGFNEQRVFNSKEDFQTVFDKDYFDGLRGYVKQFKYKGNQEVMQKLTLSLFGYTQNKLNDKGKSQLDIIPWNTWIDYIIPETLKTVFLELDPKYVNWELGNEIKDAHYQYKYTAEYIGEKNIKKRTTMPGRMQALGAMCKTVTALLLELGADPRNIQVNVIDDLRYPNAVSTADMMIGDKKIGAASGIHEFFLKQGKNIDGVPYLRIAYHQILREDGTFNDFETAMYRLIEGDRLKNIIVSTDGRSRSGYIPHGVNPGCVKLKYQRLDSDEVYDIANPFYSGVRTKLLGQNINGTFCNLLGCHFYWKVVYICRTKGCKNVTKWYHPEDKRISKICPTCGKEYKPINCTLFTGFKNIHKEILEAQIRAYRIAFGEYPSNRGKFPPIGNLDNDDIAIEIIPDGEPIEEITTEVIMKLTLTDKIKKYWNENKLKFIGVVIVCGLAIWKVLEIIFWK